MAERILVTGATGKLGRELVRLLTARNSVVRAATRSAGDAQRMFRPDVEVVELDYRATETYDMALQWVDSMFLMPPPFDPDAYDTLGAFLDWAVSCEVRRVVLLSAMDAESVPDLALRKVERHLEELGVAYSILRPNLYMQNFTSGFLRDAIAGAGEFELNAGDGRVSFVDVRDVAAIAAAALDGGEHDGRAYTLTGEQSLDLREAAALIAKAAGRTVEYRPVAAERMREILRAARWPERQIDVILGLFDSVRRGRREPVSPDVRQVLGRAPVRFEDFVQESAAAWR